MSDENGSFTMKNFKIIIMVCLWTKDIAKSFLNNAVGILLKNWFLSCEHLVFFVVNKTVFIRI